jgi:small subunit ribosomal protein S8
MSVSDPIADMLTCIRNAAQARHRRVDVPASRIKQEIAGVLMRENYVANVKRVEDGKQGLLRIYLRYDDDEKSIISGLKRVSTPGRRIYVNRHSVPRVQGGMGTAIVSTSQGILTDREARVRGLGGELLCMVW